jgi:hypothetical protein
MNPWVYISDANTGSTVSPKPHMPHACSRPLEFTREPLCILELVVDLCLMILKSSPRTTRLLFEGIHGGEIDRGTRVFEEGAGNAEMRQRGETECAQMSATHVGARGVLAF